LLRETAGENLTAKGAYILREASAAPKVILMATGSEVEIAVNAREALRPKASRPASSRSRRWSCSAPRSRYRREVLPAGTVRIAIEAGVRSPGTGC
jgi:transketolase